MKELQKMFKSKLGITALDIGARSGFKNDLLPIAPIINAIGFEPDEKECEALNKFATNNPWKSTQYLPIALGTGEKSVLHFYKQAGCSSLLEADQNLGNLFSRGDYYILEKTENVKIVPLDEAAKKYGFEKASYMKIDIQGAEMDVFISGKNLMAESIMEIRMEVSFIPLYKNQPLFTEVDSYLRGLNFVLMDFLEQHHWRRNTKIKYPLPYRGEYPFSKGQLVHGDVLYLRSPESLSYQTEQDKEKILELALISLAYGYIDHAQAAFGRNGISEYIWQKYKIKPSQLLAMFSKLVTRKTRIDLMKNIFVNLRNYIKTYFK